MNYTDDYFIGLDIGTDSVGWAVTDTDYHLLKANQKMLWKAICQGCFYPMTFNVSL